MPNQIIQPSAPGSADQWALVGAATSLEAIQKGSGDSSYIESGTLFAYSDFFCGSGAYPVVGKVVGITLHYRLRATVLGSGATVGVAMFRSGFLMSMDPVMAIPNTWIDGELRVRDSWTTMGSRPLPVDVADLGVGIAIMTAPSSGTIQLSEMWIEVETVDTPYCYDPFSGSLPNVLTGDLHWDTFGTQPVSLTVDKYLEIVDTSNTDFRVFATPSVPVQLIPDDVRTSYITEIETRVIVTTPVFGTIHLAAVACLMNNTEKVCLTLIRSGTQCWVGLVMFDMVDLAAYQVSAPIDNLLGESVHFRVQIDRDSTPETYGQVKVWMNYQEDPILQLDYVEFTTVSTPVTGMLFFGTMQYTQSTLKYDYLAFRHYKKRAGEFKAWTEWDQGSNEIAASSTDPDIVHPVLVNPPGMMVGQSQYCCVLDAQDPTVPCSVFQTTVLPAALPVTYGLGLDYKVLSPGPQTFELLVQRASDLWYWDTGLSAWVSGPASVTVPYSASRVRASSLMTGIGLPATGPVIVTVKSTLAAVPAHQILIYKVFLYEE
jgi:hypothetical protein